MVRLYETALIYFVLNTVRRKSGSQASTSDERPFSCSKCGRSYKRKHHLSRHSQYECGVEPGYSCSLCDFRAKRRDNLQDHLVRYHEVDPSQLKVYKAGKSKSLNFHLDRLSIITKNVAYFIFYFY